MRKTRTGTSDNIMLRRKLLQLAAGLAVGHMAPSPANARVLPEGIGTGKPGEFDFLTGDWKIHQRRLKSSKPDDWDVFEGEATCFSILGGIASIEELRIPSRNFSGMGLRLLDVDKKVWSDFWVNSKSGVLVSPGVTGSFENGVGTFISEEEEKGKTIHARGRWDLITKTSCRWEQATSKDGGKSWDTNWSMEWTRV